MKKAERNQIEVTRKGANRIRAGLLWIFKSDIRAANADGGSIVTVLDERRKFLGKAFYSDKSEISLRFITNEDVRVDKEFWRKRILEAAKRRTTDKGQGTNAKRLIYSEGDLISSLV